MANDTSELEKRVHQTMEHIANHPPFTNQWQHQGDYAGRGVQLVWAGDPAYAPWNQLYWTSPICPHCGKCRYCGR